MSITVNTNTSSLIAQRSLNKATNKMNQALQRLSTGLKINSAKDDAAGSAISTKLEYKISSYDVAKDNAQMGQSMLDTANSTLGNINSMLQRMRDLSEQAANGTYGKDERKAMQAEADALTEEIYRIKNTTEFNGKKVLGQESSSEVVNVTVDMMLSEVSEANWADTDGKVIGIRGYNDLAKLSQLIEICDTSNRTFSLMSNINLDGVDWTPIGKDATSSFKGNFEGNNFTISNLDIKDTNGDCCGLFGYISGGSVKNLKLENFNIQGSGIVGCLSGKFDNGTIENIYVVDSTVKGTANVGGITGASLNLTVNNTYFEGNISSSTGETGGVIGWAMGNTLIDNCKVSATISSSNGSGIGGLLGKISGPLTINNSTVDGSVSASVNNVGGLVGSSLDSFTTITNSGANCKVSGRENSGTIIGLCSNVSLTSNKYSEVNGAMSAIGKGHTTSSSEAEKVLGYKPDAPDPFANPPITYIDSYEECTANLQVGITSDKDSIIQINTSFLLGRLNVDLSSEKKARKSIDELDKAIAKVTDKQTAIGSVQNRLESTMDFQDIQYKSLSSANSYIKDADIAKESANYIKNQILQQVASSLLATANQNPNIALQLM